MNPKIQPHDPIDAEDALGQHLAKILAPSGQQLEPKLGLRLDAARQAALLAAQRQGSADDSTLLHTSGSLAWVRGLGHKPGLWIWLVCSLLILAGLGYTWQQSAAKELEQELGVQADIDLLLDELPPAAYADAGFMQYLQQAPSITQAPGGEE